MPAKIIAIATHKGGTGKTVTAMSLSAALARRGKRTLLIDFDPQGHSSLGLGVDVEDGAITLRDLLMSPPPPLEKGIYKTHIEGLDVIPSNIRLELLSNDLYIRPHREKLLPNLIAPVRDRYDFVIVDCPPSLNALTQMALSSADLVLVPCQMEARASDALVDLLEMLDKCRAGEPFPHWRVLYTRVDARRSVTNEAVKGALARWNDNTLQTIIPQSEPLNQAQIERTDIFSFDPTCKGALAYEALATEILNYGY